MLRVVVHKSRKEPSFPLQVSQNVLSFTSELEFIPKYNVSLNEVQSLSPLNNNICLLDLGDDIDRLLNKDHVGISYLDVNHDYVYTVEMSLNFDININMEDIYGGIEGNC